MKASNKSIWAAMAAATAVAMTSGCAGTVGGQLDGKDVPGFGSLAFGQADVTGGGAFIFGVGVPGDSCTTGGDLLTAIADQAESGAKLDRKGVEGAQSDQVDILNGALKVDDWYAQLLITANDDSDIRDETIDLGDTTPKASISFGLCRQKGEAEIKEGGIDQNADCYTAKDGEFALNHTDDNKLSLKATDEVKFVDGDGDTAGRVTFDFTFTRCDAMDGPAQDFVDAVEAANAAAIPPNGGVDTSDPAPAGG